MWPGPVASRRQDAHASSSSIQVAGSVLSLSTKQSKFPWKPVRASDAHTARRPAKTRSTGSSQIGITSAVRAAGSIGPWAGALPRWMAKRSPRRSSTTKPNSAVQKPTESQPKRAPKKNDSTSSSECRSRPGRTSSRNAPAAMLGSTTSRASSTRRIRPRLRQRGDSRSGGGVASGAAAVAPGVRRLRHSPIRRPR